MQKTLVLQRQFSVQDIVLEKKVGDYVNKGDVLAKIAANTEEVDSVVDKVIASYHLGNEQKQTKLIKRIITA